jgi:hypothetical protein
MTNLLKDIFIETDQDKVLLTNILSYANSIPYTKAVLRYNYHFYSYLYNLVEGIEPHKEHLYQAIYYFMAKEKNISQTLPVINNTFQMASVFVRDDLLNIINSRRTSLLQINSDAAALGALMALHSKIYHTSKAEILAETLLIAKSMV